MEIHHQIQQQNGQTLHNASQTVPHQYHDGPGAISPLAFDRIESNAQEPVWVVKRPPRPRPQDHLRLEGQMDLDTTFRSTYEQFAKQRLEEERKGILQAEASEATDRCKMESKMSRRRRNRPQTSLKPGGTGYFNTLTKDSYKYFVIVDNGDGSERVAHTVDYVPVAAPDAGTEKAAAGVRSRAKTEPGQLELPRMPHIQQQQQQSTITADKSKQNGDHNRFWTDVDSRDADLQQLSRSMQKLIVEETGPEGESKQGRVSRCAHYVQNETKVKLDGSTQARQEEARIFEINMPPNYRQPLPTHLQPIQQQQSKDTNNSYNSHKKATENGQLENGSSMETVNGKAAKVCQKVADEQPAKKEPQPRRRWSKQARNGEIKTWTVSGHSGLRRAPIRRNTDHIQKEHIIFGMKDDLPPRDVAPVYDFDIYGHRAHFTEVDHIKEMHILNPVDNGQADEAGHIQIQNGHGIDVIDYPAHQESREEENRRQSLQHQQHSQAEPRDETKSQNRNHKRQSPKYVVSRKTPIKSHRTRSRGARRVRKHKNEESCKLFEDGQMEFLTTNKSYFGLDNRTREEVLSRLSRQGTAGKTTRGNGSKVRNLFKESPEYPLSEPTAPFDDHTTYKTLFQDKFYCLESDDCEGSECEGYEDDQHVTHDHNEVPNGNAIQNGHNGKLPAINYK